MITEQTTKGDISLELPRVVAKLWVLSQFLIFLDSYACGFGDSDKDLFGVGCIIEDISEELELMEKGLYPRATQKEIKKGLERIKGGGDQT